MPDIGILTKVDDLRTVWKNEERDFSVWLSKESNLALLSKEIGVDLVLEEREAAVGSFSVDIMAVEEGTDRKIIVENQLSDTNHDHLGKIITYASGKDASVIVWIVKRAREEHRQAIDWLNEHTDNETGFFLIEIELWQIGDSLPAPKLNVISRPNDWAKTMKRDKSLSDTKQIQYRFWEAFKNYASTTDLVHSFNLRKVMPQHWYNFSIGISGAYISLTVDSQKKLIRTELYIPDDKDLYATFESKKNEIENELEFKMDWQPIPDGKACRIMISNQGDLKTESKWEDYFKWYIEKIKKMKEVFNKYK
jgi:hypothetical protein